MNNSSSVYAFEYTPCQFESDFRVISLHKTKATAYKVMMKHKNERWYEERQLGIESGDEICWRALWRIREIPVEP